MTHEQYLDEPLEVIQWMLRIHNIVEPLEERRRDGALRNAIGG